MRDYWLTQYLLSAIGWGYLIIVLIVILLALLLIKEKSTKTVAILVVLGLASILPIRSYQEYAKEKEAGDAYRARLAKAQALFDKRCETAGEKIYKTIENVEGVRLLNPRSNISNVDRANRDWPGAGFPGESGGNQYIMEFLYFHKPRSGLQARELGWARGGLKGYSYVDVDEQGKHFRYKLLAESQYVYGSDPLKAYGKKEQVSDAFSRYIIAYESIEDQQGRESWIAGGHVTVVDQKNGELLGEFVRYSFDPGFGDTYGERSPWGFAKQCPLTGYGGSSGHIRSFVEQVLKPKRSE
jgi:hypothetical protein